MKLRSLAEYLSRGVTFKRRLPEEFGSARLAVSPGLGGLRYWRPGLKRVDPDLLKLAAVAQQGMVVWDIGANMGLFSFAAAFRVGLSGAVLAVEPDTDNVQLLLRSRNSAVRAGGYAPVDVVPFAVVQGDSRIARFEIAKRARASNALEGFGSSQAGGVLETRWVPAITLDGLLHHFRPPDILKIDVEGAEAEVLRGGVRILGEVRPVIFVEVSRQRGSQVEAMFRSSSYSMFNGEAARPLDRQTPSAEWNCVAVPEERLEEARRWFGEAA